MTTRPEPARYGPSSAGSVVLELGPGKGALVLLTPPELDGTEIEISLLGDPGRRTHSLVRPRHVTAGTQYAAVYPGVPPGEYTIWRDKLTPVNTITISDGLVTTTTWPAWDG
jgi:hypothetical protein